MKTIYKFPISVSDSPEIIHLPKGTVFLHVAEQHGAGVCVWVELDTDKSLIEERRGIQVFGTGHDIPDGYEYIGTWQQPPFVWHLYEFLPAEQPDGSP